MHSALYNLLADAILNKKVITAIFDGHPRVLSPHTIGLNSQGEEQALFCQHGGSSKEDGIITPQHPYWRCMPIAKLENVQVINDRFHTIRVNGTNRSNCVPEVHIEVTGLDDIGVVHY